MSSDQVVVAHIGLINTTWIGALMVLVAAFMSMWSFTLDNKYISRKEALQLMEMRH
ncbi:hypothetical protein [Sporolactobacillus nakayamae]|uniref:hypothetical protein n=1 Tax=Sporolactobacillus nakayamae TaxID=269670 RepID=UPI0015A51FB7|nr:hypothetical protein [Sporolactobacillus nakayamae]